MEKKRPDEKARDLVRSSFIADAHLDLAFDVWKKKLASRSDVLETDYYDDMTKGGLNLVVSSIFVEDKYIPEMALRIALNQVEALFEDIESSDHFTFCRNRAEIEKANKNDKIAIILCFEGIEPLYNDLNLLMIFKRLGVRGLGFCWNRRNLAADSSEFIEKRKGVEGGLTALGFDFLEKAYEEGLFVDLSHMNDQGVAEAIQFFKGKPMVSHTNSRRLNYTTRNISDEQIKSISKADGFIGVNAMNFLVSNGDISEDIKGYCDHIDHFVKVGGEDCVGLGFDFNEKLLAHIPEHELVGLPRVPFDCIKGYRQIPDIIEELLHRNYETATIEKILGLNLLKIMR